jgi:hypothetical protein
MNYNKINNYVGWGVFGVALVVYLLTVAPTASFWDCGEFIACANELEVTHPPGAPLFLLIGRIFAMLSFGDKANIAFMVNLISVFASAFSAMFTCWITTYLSNKIVSRSNWDEKTKLGGVMLAGIVAGLTCTFCDSIWFNAVEAEVYALSLFFTTIVVWLMFKWEARADEEGNLKWIILIAYIMGLSIGVHLLNLLTIPALALIYYFRKFTPNVKGVLLTFGISVGILGFIQYGIIQQIFSVAQHFELFFTGSIDRSGAVKGGLGMPMGTGSMIWATLIVLVTVSLLLYSIKKQNVAMNTAVLSFIVIMLGFSSYTLIFIRSGANPPLDMNNPENVMTFLSYMRREQYGDRPLIFGPRYNITPKNDGERYIFKDDYMRYTLWDRQPLYVEDEMKQDYDYNLTDQVLFPRMFSEDKTRHYNGLPYNSHGYEMYVTDKGDPANIKDDKPTMFEDIHFFIDYQFNHMYLRYFMWNFAGRESDIQDSGWWFGYGPEGNKGRNFYLFLPLLLGIMGIFWQGSYDKKDTAMVFLLFFFTGIAIIIYLNQTPSQPRERDYSYAGSFQTFSIWVGMGVLFLMDLFMTSWASLKKNALYISAGVGLLAPLLMAYENWDDHTRKGRWIDIDFAYNMLNSCEKNAVIFTGGDNDTFPLWYLQEVEGVRTDVRVVNLELFISDWYIEQIGRKANESEPLPISMNKNDYAGEKFNFYDYTSQKLNFPVNKAALVKNGTLSESEALMAQDTFQWDLKARSNSYIFRKDSALISLVRNIAKDNWVRPVYFANTLGSSAFLGLDNYLQLEGLAHRVLPIKKTAETVNDMYHGRLHQEKMYENLLKKFKYRGLNDIKTNLDDHARDVIVGNYRNSFFRLTNTYAETVELYTKPYTRIDTVEGKPIEVLVPPAQGHDAEVDAARAKMTEIYQFYKKTLPYETSPPQLNQVVMWAQMLWKSDLVKFANTEFAQVTKMCRVQLNAYKRNGRTLTAENPALQGFMVCIQYYAEEKNMGEAEKLAAELKAIVGSDVGYKIIEQTKE